MAKTKKTIEMTHKCPMCESTELLVYEQTAFELNTGEFFCHAVKAHDSDAEVSCQSCGWIGDRRDFSE